MTFYRPSAMLDFQFNNVAQTVARIHRQTGFTDPRSFARRDMGVVDREFSNSQKTFEKIQKASGVRPFLPSKVTEDEVLLLRDPLYGLTKKSL